MGQTLQDPGRALQTIIDKSRAQETQLAQLQRQVDELKKERDEAKAQLKPFLPYANIITDEKVNHIPLYIRDKEAIRQLRVRLMQVFGEAANDQTGSEVARWNFERGWPSKVSGPQPKSDSGDISIEEMVIVHEYIERVS